MNNLTLEQKIDWLEKRARENNAIARKEIYNQQEVDQKRLKMNLEEALMIVDILRELAK